MRAVITRKMNVANDAGEAQQFAPPAEGQPPFVTVSREVFNRLKRSGAAVAYVEPAVVSAETVQGDVDADEATVVAAAEEAKPKRAPRKPKADKAAQKA